MRDRRWQFDLDAILFGIVMTGLGVVAVLFVALAIRRGWL